MQESMCLATEKWIRALMIGGVDPDSIEKTLPYLGVLIKKDEDLETIKQMSL